MGAIKTVATAAAAFTALASLMWVVLTT
jgi:hypothetical protein